MNDNLDTNANQDGGDVNGTGQAWLSSLPENLRSNDAFKGIESSSDAWQQFVDMKVSSADSVRIPGENATDDERSAFMSKMGRPETATDYTFTKPEGIPDGMPYDENLQETFKGVFHELGLSDANAGALWNKYHDIAVQGHEAQQKADKEAYDASVNSLKDEWKGDTYKANTELAHRAFTNVFTDEAQQAEAKTFLEETKVGGVSIGDHPMFLKMFQQVGSIISDDRLNHGRSDNVPGGDSEEAAAQKRFPNTNYKK